jgi:hypothetical protein
VLVLFASIVIQAAGALLASPSALTEEGARSPTTTTTSTPGDAEQQDSYAIDVHLGPAAEQSGGARFCSSSTSTSALLVIHVHLGSRRARRRDLP